MSVEVWGTLPKSSEDPEKVEEAIDRIVGEHNDDPDAHLGENQALQSHRASEIIDHVARSVVGDKINTIEDMMRSEVYEQVTGIGSNYIDDSTAAWETDQWVGRFLIVTEGDFNGMYLKITSNTATRIYYDNTDEAWFEVGQYYAVSLVEGTFTADGSYLGGWPFNGRYMSSDVPGEYLQRTLNCNLLTLVCTKGPAAGKLDVYIDDVLDSTIDLYAAEYHWRAGFGRIGGKP